MEYRYYFADSIRDGVTPIVLVRQATKKSGSLAILADEMPSGPQRQVLLMSGMQGRNKIPLVLGDDSTVANVVGSVLVRVQENRLAGILGFASDEQAQSTRTAYLAGKLSLSMTTKPLTGIELRAGESFCGVDGPAVVLTAWEPLQAVLG